MTQPRFTASPTHSAVQLSLLGYLCTIAALALASLWAAGFSVSAFLVIAIVLALLVPMMIPAQRGAIDLFEPIVAANVALGIMFVGRPLVDLFSGQFDSLDYDIRPALSETLAVALIGILCLQAGYFGRFAAVTARYVPALSARFAPTTWLAIAWVSVVLGAGLFWQFLGAEGGISLFLFMLEGRRAEDSELYLQSTGYFYQGPLLWIASALLFFAVASVGQKSRYYVYSLVVSLGFLILYGAQGARSNLLVPLLALPVFWFLRKGRRPSLRGLLIFLIVGLSLLGWLREIRVAGERGDVVEALATALTSPATEVAGILTGGDAEMFDAFAAELLVVPEKLPFQHGTTISDIFVRATPRPLWPSKPMEANDTVAYTLWPERYTSSRSGPAFSIIGPFYADSGVPSVMIGMFIVGIALRVLWCWFQRCSHAANAQLFYSATLPFVVILMRGTIPDTLARALFIVGPLLLATALVRRTINAPTRGRSRN